MPKDDRRVGSKLDFDEEREAYIIERVDALKSTHKFGRYVSNLIRIAMTDPKKLRDSSELNSLLEETERYGMYPETAKFFNGISKELGELQNKVNSIYDMCLKMYTLSLFGKRLGLDKSVEPTLAASFLLERHITTLYNKLGLTGTSKVFESDKVHSVEEKAEEILEYIIKTYDGITSEIVQMATPNVVNASTKFDSTMNIMRDTLSNNSSTTSGNSNYQQLAEPVKIPASNVSTENNMQNSTEDFTDDVVDFGNNPNLEVDPVLDELLGGMLGD